MLCETIRLVVLIPGNIDAYKLLPLTALCENAFNCIVRLRTMLVVTRKVEFEAQERLGFGAHLGPTPIRELA